MEMQDVAAAAGAAHQEAAADPQLAEPDAPEAAAQPGVLRPVNPADAQFANEVLRCGIRIFPGIVELTSERIVEHYGRLGQNHSLIGIYIFFRF